MTAEAASPTENLPPTKTHKERLVEVVRRAIPPSLLYAFYVFLATGCFLPAFSRLDTALIGKPGSDVLRNVWGFWWFKAMLFERFRVPAFTTYLNFPRGMLILVIDPLNCLLSLPLQLAFGLPAAYNLYLLAVVAFSAFTACLFARYLTGSLPAGIIAGTIYGFAPYVLSGSIAGNSEVVNVGWIPLFLMYFHRSLAGGGRRNGLLAGLFLICTTLSSWYYGYIVTLFAALYLVGFLLHRLVRRRPIKPSLKALSLCALCFALFTIVMVALFYDIIPSVLKSTPQGEHDQVTILAGNAVNLWEIYQPAPDRWDRPSLYHLPPVLLIMLPLALLLGIKRAWPWALLSMVALLLAMSYKVQTYPVELQAALWQAWEKLSVLSSTAYTLFLKLPLSSMLRFPARFLVIVNLGVGLIVACGLRVLLIDRPTLRPIWLALACVGAYGLTHQFLTISKFHQIFSMTPTTVPEYVKIIAKDPDWVGVTNLPTNLQGGMQLYYQTIHEKPLINYVDFVTARLYYINGNQIPLSYSDGLYGMHLRGFDRATESFPLNVPDWPTQEKLRIELAQLKHFGLRYIVVERPMFKPESLMEFEALFAPFVTPLLRTEDVDLYRLK